MLWFFTAKLKAQLNILDLRSVVIVTGVMACFMSLVLYFQWQSYPKTIDGFRHWIAAPLVACVASVLFALRGVSPGLAQHGWC